MRRLLPRLRFKPFLAALALLGATGFGAYLGWLTHAASPRLELRSEDEVHPCFFSDDESELVTEYAARRGQALQRGFIAWDLATGREKERWEIPADLAALDMLNTRDIHERYRLFCDLKQQPPLEILCYQVRPWRLLTRIKRVKRSARFIEGVFGQAYFPGSGKAVLLNLCDEEASDPEHFQVEVWDLQSAALRARLQGSFGSFSPDGARVVTAYNGRLRLWRLPDGAQLGSVLEGETFDGGHWWADSEGRVLIRETHRDGAERPFLRWIDVDSGYVLWETPGFSFQHFSPGCPYGIGENAAPPAMEWRRSSTIFRWALGQSLQPIRTLPGLVVVHFVGLEEDRVGKTVLASEEQSPTAGNQVLGWLVRRSWVQEGPPENEIVVVNLRTGQDELRFRACLSNRHRFVLSPRGDMLACEVKREPAAATPPADTGEFPCFVQVWDLPGAFPWARVLLFGLLPPLVLILAWQLLRRWRRRRGGGGA